MMDKSSTAEQCGQLIDTAIAQLRSFSQWNAQHTWLRWDGDLPPNQACNPTLWTTWNLAALNDKGYIEWPQGKQTLWLGQVFELGHSLFEYPLEGLTVRLALRWWAEQADIYVNGTHIQAGDLFDCATRVVLTESLVAGEKIAVAIRLVSPGHDIGALVHSIGIYEPTNSRIDPGMVASELAVLNQYLAAFQPEALSSVVEALQDLAWPYDHSMAEFEQALHHLRLKLQPWGDRLKQRQIHWIGHAHLDLAWLWPVAETWEAAERTFISALNLQKDFEELNFCHSSPALYAWIEQHRPALFAQIQQRVAEGRWEVAAGLWVEPELNLISGESLVRQVLYGQRYTQERFGHISRVAWLPDSFGFCSQLPQLLKQGGVDYFLTQKLRWNDTTPFPHEAFWWQAPDGTRIFSVMTPPIGEAIDPVKMGNYAQGWEAKTHLKESFWLPGVGDHGGGPTRDMLEVGRRWQQSPLFPQLKSSTMTAFCQQVETQLQEVPVWNDELYLEFHRGCYTSHADQKRYNRRCEHWLTEEEMFSAIATILTQTPYPKTELEAAWKKVLFNQFHDILPGSSIPEVFVDANRDWEQTQHIALDLREKALGAIATQIHLPAPPLPEAVAIVVHNSLNWERSEGVAWQILDHLPTHGTVWDQDGQPQPTQIIQDRTLGFWADSIPSVGYRTFWYIPSSPMLPGEMPAEWTLDNGILRVEVCPKTGTLKSVWDYAAQREVLAGAGNQLQFFQDQGQYWDAWNIDPDYANHALEAAQLTAIAWVNPSPTQQRLRVVLQWRQSVFTQDYLLEWRSPLLKIETQVDWQENHVLVKTAFPVTVTAEFATYEVPCGAIERPTLPNPQPLTAHQNTKWEVPALHWGDLTESDGTYGVSLLNDCKYGYDANPNGLRLTLLRSPTWPDPECDHGLHQFTYALYPHLDSWQKAHTVRRGYELNRPLIAQTLPPPSGASGTLPQSQSFFTGFAENLVLMALKQSEDSAQQWVIRCYEAWGQSAPLAITTILPLQFSESLDGLEQPTSTDRDNIRPWQVRSQGLTQGQS